MTPRQAAQLGRRHGICSYRPFLSARKLAREAMLGSDVRDCPEPVRRMYLMAFIVGFDHGAERADLAPKKKEQS